MHREGADFYVEHGGEPAQPLRADAERVDAVAQVEPHFLELRGGTAGAQGRHVDRVEQRLLGEDHGALGRAPHAEPDQPGRAPAGAQRLHRAQNPIRHAVARVEAHEARLVLRPAPLGGDMDVDAVAGHELHVQVGGRVVARVAAGEERGLRHHRGAQRGLLSVSQARRTPSSTRAASGRALSKRTSMPTRMNTLATPGILADGAAPEGRHAGIDQDLPDGVAGRGTLLAAIALGERRD